MTLKEKFKEQELYINFYNFKLTKESADKLEKITDDYAIEFWNWMSENYLTYYHELSIWNKENYKYSSKELLEIFKKEKGL